MSISHLALGHCLQCIVVVVVVLCYLEMGGAAAPVSYIREREISNIVSFLGDHMKNILNHTFLRSSLI